MPPIFWAAFLWGIGGIGRHVGLKYQWISVSVRVRYSPPNKLKGVLRISETEYRKEPVRGYEEYSVDTNGVVYSKAGRPLKYSLNHKGYCIVNFLKDGRRKGFAVHTLVAKQFIRNDDPRKTQVNHKDGVKTNNCVQNLEWMTPMENTRHKIEVLGNDTRGAKHHGAKSIRMIDKKTKHVIHEFGSLSDAIRFASLLFGVKENTARTGICRVLYRYRKSYKGMIWQYI